VEAICIDLFFDLLTDLGFPVRVCFLLGEEFCKEAGFRFLLLFEQLSLLNLCFEADQITFFLNQQGKFSFLLFPYYMHFQSDQ
jgi:hypothetical protein